MGRILSFKVTEQELSKDPNCSFEGLVSGTKGYLTAKVSFNKTWVGCAKVAVFRKLLEEYPVPMKNDSCSIPSEALNWDKFSMRIVGKKRDGSIITTNEVEIHQKREGSHYADNR